MGGIARLVVRIALLALLAALIPAGYLTYEYYLKPWGADRLKDYARAATAASSIPPDLSGALIDGVACVRCVGVNNVFPVTAKSHPTYSGFQKMLMNDGGWITQALLIAVVAIGGGGSLLLALLYAVTETSPSAPLKPTSSTAFNGCGLFEMLLLVGQAQFLTMLGALELDGAPLFFLEFTKKLAWTNLQIFPRETTFRPVPVEVSSAVAGASRRFLLDAGPPNATGVERFGLLLGVQPNHFFYYTCAALAVALAGVLVAYLFLRVLLSVLKKQRAAAAMDHRVIWVFLVLLQLAQYAVAMASCFQIYYTLSDAHHRSTGDVALAILIVLAACVAFPIFCIIKLARHTDMTATHGLSSHDATKWFHLRYSALYQDCNLANLYFFVAKMVLDTMTGVVVATLQDAPLQLAILITLHAVLLAAVIWRQPFVVPLFYVLAVATGFVRIVLLLVTLVQTKTHVFAQDVRDYVAALTILINAVFILGVLVRQLYVLCMAMARYASRSPIPVHVGRSDAEMGMSLQHMSRHNPPPPMPGKNASMDTPPMPPPPASSVSSRSSTQSKSRRSRDAAPIADSTLFASQPYHAMYDGDGSGRKSSKRRAQTDRHSLPSGYASATSTDDGSTASAPAKGGGRRSMYARRAQRHRDQLAPTKKADLPDWAKV